MHREIRYNRSVFPLTPVIRLTNFVLGIILYSCSRRIGLLWVRRIMSLIDALSNRARALTGKQNKSLHVLISSSIPSKKASKHPIALHCQQDNFIACFQLDHSIPLLDRGPLAPFPSAIGLLDHHPLPYYNGGSNLLVEGTLLPVYHCLIPGLGLRRTTSPALTPMQQA